MSIVRTKGINMFWFGMMGLGRILRNQADIAESIDKLTQTVCTHEVTNTFTISRHSENKAGYDIIEVTYCDNCRKHLDKKIKGFKSYGK